jgi:hypothetical protein
MVASARRLEPSDSESVSPMTTESGTDDSDNDSDNDSGSAPATEWVFNGGLKQVLHDVNHCPMCTEFAVHYSDAMIRLHPTHRPACLARKRAIANNVQKQIDHRRSRLEELNNTILDHRRKLEGVRGKMEIARLHLEGRRTKLKQVRCGLELRRMELKEVRRGLEDRRGITRAVATMYEHS